MANEGANNIATPAQEGGAGAGASGDDGANAGAETQEALPNVAAGGEAQASKEGEASKTDAAAKSPAADIELKLPEGLKVDEVALGKFKQLVKESGLDSPKAQKLYDFYLESQQLAAKAVDSEIQSLQQEWAKQLRADKEVGGKDFTTNFQTARKALERFATPELKQYLVETGLGGHPEIVRLFARVGKAIAEDSVAGTAANGVRATPANSEEAFWREMYPNSPQLFEKKE